MVKERKQRNSTPFLSRLVKRMDAVGKAGTRIEKHAKKMNDDAAQDLATAMIKASRLAATFAEGKPADWRPAGSNIGKKILTWEKGSIIKVRKDFAFLYPNLKEAKEYTVKDIKKYGKGRGSKTFLQLNDAEKTFVQAAFVERIEAT